MVVSAIGTKLNYRRKVYNYCGHWVVGRAVLKSFSPLGLVSMVCDIS